MKATRSTLASALFIFSFLSPHLAQAALTDGLVGHWTLDGKDVSWATGVVTDRSGQGNSGKVVSMSTTTSPVAGKVGQGLKFDGVDDYVTVGNTSALQVTGAVTVSVWVKGTTTATNGGIAGKYDSAASQRGYLLAQENVGGSKKITWYYQNLAGTFDSGDSVTTLSDVLDNRWHHVVGVYSPSSYARIYVDGILNNEDTTSIDSSIANNTASFLVGAFNSGAQPINSSIDDVRVYNRALSAQEIQQLYAQGATKMGVSPSPSSGQQGLGAGLVGHWTLDGKDVSWATGTVTDRSGQGNNGKVVSMSTTTSPVAGKVGQGLNFDGTNDYVNHGDVLDMGANSLSACGWFKADNPAISNGGIIGKTVAASGMGRWAVYFEGGKIKALLARGTLSADNAIASTTIANLTLPHHFCAVYDRSNLLTLYVDAVSVSTISIASTTPTNYNTTYPLWIGAYQDATATGIYPGYAFDGLIDDVRVYNRVLSAQEVRQLYALGGSKVAVSPTFAPLTTGLVGHWTLDGKDVSWATGTVTDKSGQGNSGKVVSMSTTTSTLAGKIGQGLYFNGSTNYITVPDNDTFTITGARTFSLWMKTASTTGFRAINKSTGPILNTSEWALGTSGGGLYYVIFYDSGATANNCSVGSTVSASTDVNIWTHLIVTYSGSGGCSGIKLYRNAVDVTGSVVNAGTGFSSFSNTSAPVTLGVLHKGDPTYEAWAKGTMDDVRVYSRALSAQEVRQLYSVGRAANN